jgi:hypothetical protein
VLEPRAVATGSGSPAGFLGFLLIRSLPLAVLTHKRRPLYTKVLCLISQLCYCLWERSTFTPFPLVKATIHLGATCRIQSRDLNPEGITSSAQGWRFSSQPWERVRQEFQPPRGCVNNLARANIQTDTTLSGLQLISLFTQGWLNNANPGLED